MATNDLVEKNGTTITVEANGPAINADTFAEANDNILATTDNTGFPFMRLVFECDYATKPTDGEPIQIHKQAQDIIDTTDDEIPPNTFSGTYGSSIYAFYVAANTDPQRWVSGPLYRDTQHDLKFWVQNKTDQQIQAGWKLTVTPLTYGPSS